MTISFDLDDTLIPGTKVFETERHSILQRACGIEKVRKGTIALMKQLKKNGHRVYVYTSSLRKASKIWWMFFSYGVRLDKVINYQLHERSLWRGATTTLSTHLPST